MPITTLNKVVALFLVGGVVIFLVLFLHWGAIGPLLSKPEDVPSAEPAQAATAEEQFPAEASSFWVLLAVLLLPVSALLGGVVEGLSQVSLQRILKRARFPNSTVAKFFGQTRAKACLDEWQARLEKVALQDKSYEWLSSTEVSDRSWAMRSTAAGVFLLTGPATNYEWLVQHYSTFVMASNLAFATGLLVIYLPLARLAASLGFWWPTLSWASIGEIVVVVVLGVISFWSLCSLALSRDLYSHEHSARHMALWLADRRLQSQEQE